VPYYPRAHRSRWRVVRSESATPVVLDGIPRRQYAVAVSFVEPSARVAARTHR